MQRREVLGGLLHDYSHEAAYTRRNLGWSFRPLRPLQPWPMERRLEVDLTKRAVELALRGHWHTWQELPTWMTPDANIQKRAHRLPMMG